jgi:hypothetical protein
VRAGAGRLTGLIGRDRRGSLGKKPPAALLRHPDDDRYPFLTSSLPGFIRQLATKVG